MNATLLSDIRTRAQAGIRDRMYATAGETNEQLQKLGKEIAKRVGGKVLFGNPKDLERATQKVSREYAGDWYELKDVVRMTIIVPYESMLWRAKCEIESYCTASNGLGLIKSAETLSHLDTCGYSGYNFVVRLKNGRPGEIQVNTPEILYAKMKASSFCKALGYLEYLRIRCKYGLEGGLGHALYEVYRKEPWSQLGVHAASLSRMYYDCFRGRHAEPGRVKLVRDQLNAFKQKVGIHLPL